MPPPVSPYQTAPPPVLCPSRVPPRVLRPSSPLVLYASPPPRYWYRTPPLRCGLATYSARAGGGGCFWLKVRLNAAKRSFGYPSGGSDHLRSRRQGYVRRVPIPLPNSCFSCRHLCERGEEVLWVSLRRIGHPASSDQRASVCASELCDRLEELSPRGILRIDGRAALGVPLFLSPSPAPLGIPWEDWTTCEKTAG